MIDEMNRVMIISPHADDEVLGCGAVISKLEKKKKKIFLVLTACSTIKHRDGFESKKSQRKKEFFSLAKSLSCDAESLDCTDTMLQYEKPKIIERLEDVIDSHKPDTLFFPYKSFHQDHTAVYECCFAVLRPNRMPFVKRVFCYEVPNYIWSTEEDMFVPNFFVPFNEEEMNRKVDMCFMHKSQFNRPGSPATIDTLKRHANFRGYEIGVKYAEAFRIVSVIE